MSRTLRGKVVAVTGASSGIGRALALELARGGVDIVVNARRASRLAETARECESLGVRARSVVGDAARADTAAAIVEEARALGELDGFIHNAGALRAGPLLWELGEEGVREVLDANLAAGFQLIRFAVPELRRRGSGFAVFLGSGAAEANVPGIGAYSVAKAGVEHLARQLAAEAPELTSFVYRPGIVETRMQEQLREAEGGAAELLHEVFRGYKERGALLMPEQAAKALVRILADEPRRFQGKVATWEDEAT